MTSSKAGFGWAAGLAAVLFWGAPAFASASESAGGHLVYNAPQGCAAQPDFEERVLERGGHFDAYAAPDSGRELRVAIIQTASGYLGTFQAVSSEGASAIREVHGATCSEVVSALSVVSAIALRAEGDAPSDTAATEVEPPVFPPTPTPAPPTAPVTATAPSPAVAPIADEGHLRGRSQTGESKTIPVSAGTVRFDTARSVSVFAGGEIGILPSKVLPRYDLSLNGASFVTTPDGKSFLTGVIPRIRASYFGNGTHGSYDPASSSGFGSTYQSLANQGANAAVTARGVGVGLGLCWSPTYDTRGFVALLCAEYGLGVMQLKTTSANLITAPYFSSGASTQSTSLSFQTAGVSFEGEYRLGAFFHLALKLGVDASLQQLTAEAQDGRQIFHSSTLLGYGMLGLGFHF